jgi:hypothetical protein
MYGISTLVVQVSGAASSNAWKTSMLKGQAVKRLSKKAKKGFRGYPVATIAFYGPDNKMATKVAVAIVLAAEQEPAEPRRWISDDRDVRTDPQIAAEILTFIAEAGVMTIAMVDRIIGCPHEEGIDYEGQICPRCPYWAGRDRWTGGMLH